MLPAAPGGHHMSEGSHACERSDDSAAATSNPLQDALGHLLCISILLLKMSIWEIFKQVSACTHKEEALESRLETLDELDEVSAR